MKKNLFIITLLALPLCGCVKSSLADWQSQLANDHANLKITLSTPWGTETVDRSNPYPSNTVTVYVTNTVFVPQPAK